MKQYILFFALVFLVFLSCNNNDKTKYQNTNVSPADMRPNTANETEKLHTVTVHEILPTDDYVYLNVTEGDHKFWIATNKSDAKVGETYFYVGGLLKNNFESKSLNKVFDELYLVGNLVSSNHGTQNNQENAVNNHGGNQDDKTTLQNLKVTPQKGSIKISELVANPTKYAGKTIQIDGKCTKVNNGIMGRNWIHLKDGSNDDFDLVVTSDASVTLGSVVTMTADVVLNKDFGAGYKYDLILENGKLVKQP